MDVKTCLSLSASHHNYLNVEPPQSVRLLGKAIRKGCKIRHCCFMFFMVDSLPEITMFLQIVDKTFPDFIRHTFTEPPSPSPWCTFCTKANQVLESLAVRHRGNLSYGIFPINASMDTPSRIAGLSLPTIIEEILRLSEGTSRSELDRDSIALIC